MFTEQISEAFVSYLKEKMLVYDFKDYDEFMTVKKFIQKVAKDLKVGAIVVFITENKTYETIVSKVEFKGTFNIAKVTLGEYRLSLTDKLKLIDRRST